MAFHVSSAAATTTDYCAFLEAKVCTAPMMGQEIQHSAVNPILKPHQRVIVQWMVEGGRRACFAAFGLGKTIIQLETLRITLERAGGRGLIVIPLGVRQEFTRDAAMLGTSVQFIRRIEEAGATGIYLTNYETVRDGKLDPRQFTVASLDEASVLRGFGGTKTFREFMRLFAGDGKTLNERIRGREVEYRFVATATPSPNDYIELLSYAAYLGIMDVSAAKTRFFKRDSTKADKLTLHPHKEREFWLWVSSWAIFVQRPSDLGFSDEGYALPPLDVRWHEIPTDHSRAVPERDGQGRMFKNTAIGVVEASREKRDTLSARIAKMREIIDDSLADHFLLWHDLEAERHAIKDALPGAVEVFGSQELEERERRIIEFSEGAIKYLATKPVLSGSGCNFQRHCHRAIFVGIGFKFNDFIQATHRIQRFLQTSPVRIDLIFTEAEREVRRTLERKWQQHEVMVSNMTEIIREYGLAHADLANALTRSMGVERMEINGDGYRLINNDCVEETRKMESDSVGLILTSIPFSTQYEYSPNWADFGHTDNNEHFFRQMDFLTPELLRVLKPGRIAAIHVKDRVVPGGMTGLGFQVVYPFHAKCIEHYTRHGFAYMGMKTIVTDVVRENNQTYRLGWTEQCKDGTKMGVGMPEYLLLFRKPPSDSINSYADEPVVKSKAEYSRSRWQIDAHAFARSNGNRPITAADLENAPHERIFKLFRNYSLSNVYDFEHHVKLGEALAVTRRLPVTFMLLQPPSWHPDVWTDITRMLTLNGAQSARGKEMHLCLARGTRVLTLERGYVPIEDVQIGEHALTHKGRWRAVVVVRNTGVRRAITVRAQGVPGLTLTPDHKLWTRKSTWVRQRDGAERAEPSWVEAQNTPGGYVNLKLPDVWETTVVAPLLWWIVGRWIADGHWDAHGAAIISCGAHEVADLLSRLGEHAGGVFDTRTAHQIRLLDRGRAIRTILNDCGHGAAGKRLPAVAYTLPIPEAGALLAGYLSGDGHYLESRHRWVAVSVSRELMLGVALLAQRVHGAVASVYAGRPDRDSVIEGRRVQCRQEWILCFDLSSERRKSKFVQEDGAWKKVRSIDDAGEVETWNLRVEEDESFTAENCIVKNCPMQFDLADRVIEQMSNPGDVVLDPFGGLMTVPYRAVLKRRFGLGIELSMPYLLDGAAYCKAAAEQMAMPSLFDLVTFESEPEEEASDERPRP